MGYISVSREVEVEVDLSDLSDEELRECLEEAQSRGIGDGGWFDRDYAERAYEALLRNRYGEAAALLERCLRPTPVQRAEYEKHLVKLV